MTAIYPPMPGVEGMASFNSQVPRDPMNHGQGMVIEAGLIASTAVDRFGGVDSKVIRPGTIMARIAASGKWTPVFGADILSVQAIGSIIVYVGTGVIGRFVAGQNVKIGKPGAADIFDAVEQDCGAILTVYPTSGTVAVTTGFISAVAVGDYLFVEPATADGSGDGIAILREQVTLRNTAGAVIEDYGQMIVQGHVRSSQVLGGHGRAYLTLAGHGPAIPAGVVIVDPV